nr:DUF763 domain-containing protein [Ferruginibacter albus]
MSFVEEPHTGICGINQGAILNLTASDAKQTREGIINIAGQKPQELLKELPQLIMPAHHNVQAEDINLKRLGTVLWLAHEQNLTNFEDLLLLQGIGPRTLQSLTLVSEVIHGTPSRFKDPARFSFAHGGKDGHPFPVPTKVYDETIATLQTAVQKAKLGNSEKNDAIKKLHELAAASEQNFIPNNSFDELIKKEREDSWKYGGKTVFGNAKPPKKEYKEIQLKLF